MGNLGTILEKNWRDWVGNSKNQRLGFKNSRRYKEDRVLRRKTSSSRLCSMVFTGPSPLSFVASPVLVAWPTWQPLMRRLVRDTRTWIQCLCLAKAQCTFASPIFSLPPIHAWSPCLDGSQRQMKHILIFFSHMTYLFSIQTEN